MKKFLFLISVCGIMLTGCDDKKRPTVSAGGIFEPHYSIEVVDGCQYLRYGRCFTHKGNCTNKIHIYNK